uniref:Uncharacterized protein n=1 Tax=Setaria digitata TaxID=48799 RepID=A0A915Q0Z5_9BILA
MYLVEKEHCVLESMESDAGSAGNGRCEVKGRELELLLCYGSIPESTARSVRRAQVSKKTWNEYVKYKGEQHKSFLAYRVVYVASTHRHEFDIQQTCRMELEKDAESKARSYLSWEEMVFHKNSSRPTPHVDSQSCHNCRLLPNLTPGDALSYEDAVLLSNVDSRLLSPEPESLCKIGVTDDSDQNEIAEKSRFEDTLISRYFKIRDAG